METRNATVAVIGTGDYVGSAIARRFAAEGFAVFAGRRNGYKLAPLVANIERLGGRVNAPSLGARQLMRPEAVAEAYWDLYQQPQDAWTFEQEIRPYTEKW